MKVYRSLAAELEASQQKDSWATPSLLPDQPPLSLRHDLSVSHDVLGSPLSHSGVFADLEALAREARGANHAWPLTNGSTIGNQIAMCSLRFRTGPQRVLAAANCHHSVLNAACTNNVELRYLPGRMLAGFDALLPPTPAEVDLALAEDPAITAVWISSPTYEGITADITGIAEVVHARGAVLVVDAAWGSHFGFHPELPPSTITLGTDLVIESTHKNGGGLQGTALLLQSGDLVDPEHVDSAYRTVVSTSQSFLLMSSLEWALVHLVEDGKSYLDVALQHAQELRHGLADRGVPLLQHPDLVDLTKVTFGGVDGYAVGKELDRHGIVIEKSSVRSATMLATMQLRAGAAGRALTVLDEALCEQGSLTCPSSDIELAGWLSSRPEVEAYVAFGGEKERVTLTDSVGRIAGEQVEVYPPGIPVLAPGWLITQSAVDALVSARAAGAQVISSDAVSVAVFKPTH